MKFTAVTLLATAAVVAADRTYNITAAYLPGQLEKYKCLTTERWLSDFNIPECLHECTRQANEADGCAYDDFTCHAVNYQKYSDLIEPCAFPPQLGGNGSCTMAELGAVRPIVNAQGNFFNATLYAAYASKECTQRLSIIKTLKIVANEATVVSEKK